MLLALLLGRGGPSVVEFDAALVTASNPGNTAFESWLRAVRLAPWLDVLAWQNYGQLAMV